MPSPLLAMCERPNRSAVGVGGKGRKQKNGFMKTKCLVQVFFVARSQEFVVQLSYAHLLLRFVDIGDKAVHKGLLRLIVNVKGKKSHRFYL